MPCPLLEFKFWGPKFQIGHARWPHLLETALLRYKLWPCPLQIELTHATQDLREGPGVGLSRIWASADSIQVWTIFSMTKRQKEMKCCRT
ncbi:hypothetical protein EJB05_11742 [Eragrostis curvula]|uniref:Uncharacterized protein n=1 Tax=Eragrostis curvula TaxID=38414 RepID=A0A5J9VSA3_9POAL|nr:hypothetical protein EJB05_11742 [Eragrostis curvula]